MNSLPRLDSPTLIAHMATLPGCKSRLVLSLLPAKECRAHYGASNNRNGLFDSDYCRLAPRPFSKTASIGPSDKMLPWLAREGAYKLEALPPSRNKALGQFSLSRNKRAKASNDTSP